MAKNIFIMHSCNSLLSAVTIMVCSAQHSVFLKYKHMLRKSLVKCSIISEVAVIVHNSLQRLDMTF